MYFLLRTEIRDMFFAQDRDKRCIFAQDRDERYILLRREIRDAFCSGGWRKGSGRQEIPTRVSLCM